MLPGAWTQVEDAVGGEHDLGVVLDHQEGVAGVAQSVQDPDDAVHVPRVQPDAGLVEHEQGVDQGGAQGRGQVDALGLAPGEGARLAVQGQVAQPHLAQVAQAGAHPGQEQVQGLIQPRREGQRLEEVAAAPDGQPHEVVDVEPGQGLPGLGVGRRRAGGGSAAPGPGRRPPRPGRPGASPGPRP